MNPVSIGKSSKFGWLFAAAALITAIVGQLIDSGAPLGIPQETLIKIMAGMIVVTGVGRALQAAYGEKPVIDGPASTIGFAASIVIAVGVAFSDLTDQWTTLGISPTVMAVVSAFIGGAVILARQWQAAFGRVDGEDIPAELNEIIATGHDGA